MDAETMEVTKGEAGRWWRRGGELQEAVEGGRRLPRGEKVEKEGYGRLEAAGGGRAEEDGRVGRGHVDPQPARAQGSPG